MGACFVVLVLQSKKKLTSAKCFNRSSNAEFYEHQNNVMCTFPKVTNHLISLNTKTEKNLFKVTAYQVFGIDRTHCFFCSFCFLGFLHDSGVSNQV